MIQYFFQIFVHERFIRYVEFSTWLMALNVNVLRSLWLFRRFVASFDAFLVRTKEELAGHDAKARIAVGEAGNAADLQVVVSRGSVGSVKHRHDTDDTYQMPADI